MKNPNARGEALGDPAIDPVEAANAMEPNPFGYSDAQRRVGDHGTPITEHGSLAVGEPDNVIPPSPLWAMKVHRHFQWSHLLPHHEQHERVRLTVGSGKNVVYLMDDGHHHRIMGRHVGTAPDGARYSLVVRVTTAVANALVSGEVTPRNAILQGKGLALYGVVEDGPASNVFIITTYAAPDDVPQEYLPPNPPLRFAEDLYERS